MIINTSFQNTQQLQDSTFTITPENGTVSCTLYNETSIECTKYLQQYARCISTPDSTGDNIVLDLYISGSPNHTELKNAFDYLRYFQLVYDIRQQCLTSLMPLICLHFVHICDKETGMAIEPSVSECKHVEDVCDKELEKLRAVFPSTSMDKFLSKCASSSPLDSKKCSPPRYGEPIILYANQCLILIKLCVTPS